MRFKLTHPGLAGKALAVECKEAPGGVLRFVAGFCDLHVTAKQEEAVEKAMKTRAYPYNLFEITADGDGPPKRTTSLITSTGKDAETTQPAEHWVPFSEAVGPGLTPKRLKELVTGGQVRTREISVSGKPRVQYLKADLEKMAGGE